MPEKWSWTRSPEPTGQVPSVKCRRLARDQGGTPCGGRSQGANRAATPVFSGRGTPRASLDTNPRGLRPETRRYASGGMHRKRTDLRRAAVVARGPPRPGTEIVRIRKIHEDVALSASQTGSETRQLNPSVVVRDDACRVGRRPDPSRATRCPHRAHSTRRSFERSPASHCARGGAAILAFAGRDCPNHRPRAARAEKMTADREGPRGVIFLHGGSLWSRCRFWR